MSTTRSATRTLVEGALMIALATLLSIIPLPELPHGGSVTLCSMVPILVMSYRHGIKWGCFTAFAYSLIQLVMGLKNLAYCQTLGAQVGCVLLDYLLAFTALGLAQLFTRPFRRRGLGLGLSAAIVCALRFLCSFFSGYIVWYDYEYALEWMSNFSWGVWLTQHLGEHAFCWVYSFVYNLSYMLPETLLTVAAVVILYHAVPKIFVPQKELA